MRYPVDVSVIKANGPEFAKVLQKLTDKLTISCVSKQATLELKQASESLKEAHQSCMAHEIFLEELTDEINKYLDEESGLGVETKQYYCDIKKAMSLYKAKQFIAEDPDKLKLHKQFLQLPLEGIKITPPVNQQEEKKLSVLLQRRFQTRCEELLEIVDDASRDEHCEYGTETMADIAEMLPKIITEHLKVAEQQKETAWSKLYKNQSILRYYQDVLMGCVDNLDHMVHEVREDESFATNCEFLVAKSEACLNKLKLLEVSIQREIYSRENAKALKKLSKCLQEEFAETEEELARVNNKLAAYSHLGPEFRSTVEEYSKLLKEIEKRKWTIQEIEKHTS